MTTEVIVMPRGGGKTDAMLGWMASEPTGVCVTFSFREALRLRELARERELNIEGWRFASIENILSGALRGRPDVVIAVDNAELVLQALTGHPVRVVTVTG